MSVGYQLQVFTRLFACRKGRKQGAEPAKSPVYVKASWCRAAYFRAPGRAVTRSRIGPVAAQNDTNVNRFNSCGHIPLQKLKAGSTRGMPPANRSLSLKPPLQ
jgi:hypothetical protein